MALATTASAFSGYRLDFRIIFVFYFCLLFCTNIFISEVESLKCICEHSSCKANYCHGDLCTYVHFSGSKPNVTYKNCLNTSKATSKSFYGLEMTPEGKPESSIGSMELSICATDECNRNKPVLRDVDLICEYKSQRLKAMASVDKFDCTGTDCILGSFFFGSKEKNEDQICYQIELEHITDELHPIQICHNEKPLTFLVTLCRKKSVEKVEKSGKGTKPITASKQPAGKKSKNEKEKEEKLGKQSKVTNETGSSPSTKTKSTKPESNKEKGRNQKSAKKVVAPKEGQKGEKENQKKGAKAEVKHEQIAIEVPPPERPAPDDSNATMVTVFVLLIAAIIVVGIVWKFNLHRRLFRANYDSVAGG